jgi:hypothetical protein
MHLSPKLPHWCDPPPGEERDASGGATASVDFILFQPLEMTNYLKSAGFEIEEVIEREPYPGVEHPSRRAYIFARA